MSIDVNQLFVQAASCFAEAIYLPEKCVKPDKNAFGRAISYTATGSLSRLMATASTGLRTAAKCSAEHVDDACTVLAQCSRLHIPFTLVATNNAIRQLHRLAETGSIIFRIQEPQQLVDFIALAQVIAEKALQPVVLLTDLLGDLNHVEVLRAEQARQWYGDNDGRVPDPTPAQTIVQGKMRRRMPAWMHVDNPVMVGAAKHDNDAALERAAQQLYTQAHTQEIIDETLATFSAQFGRTYVAYQQINLANARNIVLSPCALPLTEALLNDKTIAKAKMGFLVLNQLNPLPQIPYPPKTERVLVLEPAQDIVRQGWLYRAVLVDAALEGIKKHNAWYVGQPESGAIRGALLNLLDARTTKTAYWLDVAFTTRQSNVPKYEVLAQQLQRDYPEATNHALAAAGSVQLAPHALPAAAQTVAGQGPPYTRLSRFFDDTAWLYDQPHSAIAHPFEALPLLPVHSAMYKYPEARTEIPVFIPQKVKDIERYPNACAHGALYTGLFTLADLLKSGIAQARAKGEAVAVVVPLSKAWTKFAAAEALAKRGQIRVAGDLFAPAFEKVLPTAKDKDAARAEYHHIMAAIADVPVALTDAFYVEAEQAKADSGEVFTVGIDPSACTGCGTCVWATAEGALEMKSYKKEDEQALIAASNRFEALPETAPAVTKRLLERDDFDPFAALLLNKRMYRSFIRNGMAWQKSAEGSTIGLLVAVAEYALQPNNDVLSQKISVALAGLNTGIKKMLSDALPVSKLDTLMEVVLQHAEEKLSMDRIFEEWGKEQPFKGVDKEALQRKLALVEALKQLKWALGTGANGMGRAPYSVVVDSSLVYAATHPWNGFKVPALVAQKGNTADTALGLFEGQLRSALDNIRLLRRADLELADRYVPSQHNQEIAAVDWHNLTAEEKRFVPPVVVLANQQLLAESSLKSLLRLIKTGYPIKILALEEASFNPHDALAEVHATINGMWSLLAADTPLVGRGSLAQPKALFTLLTDALTSPAAAVVHIPTPNAQAFTDAKANWGQLTALAESSRTFLPFRYDAGAQHVAAALHVAARDVKDDWITVPLAYSENGKTTQIAYALTFADYAFFMAAWKDHFTKVDKTENAVPVAAYLAMDEATAATTIPVIIRVDAANRPVRYAVSAQVLATVKAVRQNLRVLREWAGLFSAHPEKLWAEAEAELRVAYEAEHKKMQAQMAAEREVWEADYLEKMKRQVKARLLNITT